MSDALKRYRGLESSLWLVRVLDPDDATAEDPILDEMDGVWEQLTAAERALLDAEGPRCFPDLPPPWETLPIPHDRDPFQTGTGAVREAA